MSKKKMKPSSNDYRPHYVDEDTETVYLTVNGWSGAMAAPFWVHRHFPGYRFVITTEEGLKKKFNTENDA